MIEFKISHKTHYQYDKAVDSCQNELYLTPISLPGQRCVSSRTDISPLPAVRTIRRDAYGNQCTYFALNYPHEELVVTSKCTVQRSLNELTQPDPAITWEETVAWLANNTTARALEAREFCFDSNMVSVRKEYFEYVSDLFAPGTPLKDIAIALTTQIFRDFDYDPHFTTISTPTQMAFEHRKGVCQDFAHVAIGCLRSMGLAVRYCSGYLETQPPPGQEKLVGSDASHAWFSVFYPGTGWVDYDPTNDLVVSDEHILVAVGRDYSDVAPMKGVVFGNGAKTMMNVAVDVQRTPQPQSNVE